MGLLALTYWISPCITVEHPIEKFAVQDTPAHLKRLEPILRNR